MQNNNDVNNENTKKNDEMKTDANKSKYITITKADNPLLPQEEVIIARLKKIKNKKTTSDAKKIQFLETLTINNYNIDLVLIALGLDELTIHSWLVNDVNFRNLCKRFFSAYREILKLRMMHSLHNNNYKLRDCDLMLNRLPEFAEEQEKESNPFVALIPFILSDDAKNLGNGILQEGKVITKEELPL